MAFIGHLLLVLPVFLVVSLGPVAGDTQSMVCQKEKDRVDKDTQWTITIDPDPIVDAVNLVPADRRKWMTKSTARWQIPNV